MKNSTIKAYRKPLLLCACIAAVVVLYIFIKGEKQDQTTVRDYPQIASDSLNIVTDYSPFGYFIDGDSVAGFNQEFIHLLQQYCPIKINIHLEADIEESITGLQSLEYDIIFRNLPVTTALKDSLSFTEVIINNKDVLIQRKKKYNNDIAPIRSHLDLAKKTLHVPSGSPSILRINNLSKEIGDTIYHIEDSLYNNAQLVMKVALGEIDYAVCDEHTVKRIIDIMPEVDYQTSIGFTHFEAMAVRKNAPALLDSLNSWIIRIKETPDFKKLLKRYSD